jgi:hypothetical protein
LGLILILPILSTNPSHSQSLKDKINQKNIEEELRQKNCKRIQEYSQYQEVVGDRYSRFYVDPQNNIHRVSFRSTDMDDLWGCYISDGKIGSHVRKSKCEITSFRGGYSQMKYVTEWVIEGNELKEYSQQTYIFDCDTSNPSTHEDPVKVRVYTKFR